MTLSTLFDLTNRTALITGGSRGLGLEFVEGLAEAGARLWLPARRQQWLSPALKTLRDKGFDALGATCDVTKLEDVNKTVDACLQAFGKLVILINNAGISWSAQAAAKKLMIPNNYGRISVASIAGLKGVMPTGIHYAAYVASKGGLIALTKKLAAKWAQYNISVNAIFPCFFPSRITEDVTAARGEAEMPTSTPMRRISRPGKLKGVGVFLAADASNFITGQNIVVDGGRTAV